MLLKSDQLTIPSHFTIEQLIVSMMNSTESTFTISNPDKIRGYYSVFINTMAAIAQSFDTTSIKNTGTSLVYYFPKTSNFDTVPAFRNVLECGVTLMSATKS